MPSAGGPAQTDLRREIKDERQIGFKVSHHLGFQLHDPFGPDTAACTLTPQGTVSSPANVQYIWPHANRTFLYVASTDSGSGMAGGGANHHVTAYRIDPATGALSQHGAPISLPTRPIHMATDIPSKHILVAFNNPPAIRVFRINPDGTPGAEIPQSPSIDPGVFPHQVLATPDQKQVILVARGFDATKIGRAHV